MAASFFRKIRGEMLDPGGNQATLGRGEVALDTPIGSDELTVLLIKDDQPGRRGPVNVVAGKQTSPGGGQTGLPLVGLEPDSITCREGESTQIVLQRQARAGRRHAVQIEVAPGGAEKMNHLQRR